MPRINCDYNMFEFVFGVIMSGIRSSLITKDGLKNFNRYSKFKFNPKGYDYYYQRYNSMKNSKSKNKSKESKQLKSFINNCYSFKSMIQTQHKSYIRDVFVVGKNNKFILNEPRFQRIEEMNKQLKIANPKDSKKLCKSDVYVILDNDKIIGVSVKMNKKCTKFNYSVQKILKDHFKVNINNLNNIKKIILHDNGIQKSNFKTMRHKGNKLFYDRNNPYWNQLHYYIDSYNSKLASILMSNYYCTHNNLYDVYEIDDYSSYILTKNELDTDYYLEEDTQKKNRTNSAKLYYKLKKDENTIMNLEIRWKGDPFVSPQFQST
jgi:hypothetical protein